MALSELIWDSTRDAKKFVAYKDGVQVYQFLMTLNVEFEAVRASFLHKDPSHSLEKVISEVLTEETPLAILKVQRLTTVTDTTVAAISFYSSHLTKKICNYCKKPRHVISECCKLQSKQAIRSNNQFRGKSFLGSTFVTVTPRPEG